MGQIRQMLDRQQGRVSFHMPGHKGEYPFGGAFDVTELPGTDDLHEPAGPYLHLQQKAAHLCGAACSFLLVGGSTLGVEAMLLSALKPGEAVILPRNAHVSAWSACVLGGFRPLSVYPRAEADGPEGYAEEDFLRALEEHPEARALLVTRPDMYGRCLPLGRIARRCREKKVRLLVDEAHGAHLPFLKGMDGAPASAGALGADMWCQSLHKTLPALTQTALLHLRDGALFPRAKAALRLLETSSPSSLLLLSAESALEEMEVRGAERLALLRTRIDAFTEALAPRFARCIFPGMDPLRLTIDVRNAGLSGYETSAMLAEKGVDMEMADEKRIVGIPSIENGEEDFRRLAEALESLPGGSASAETERIQAYGEPCMDLREAFFSEKKWVPLKAAAGQICGAAFGLYPPGTPLAAPGERITKELAARMQRAMEQGCGAFGTNGKGEVSCVIPR